MNLYNTVYRFETGHNSEVTRAFYEGFSAVGLTLEAAKERAHRQALDKLLMLEGLNAHADMREIDANEFGALDKDTREELKNDWHISRQ